MLAGYLFVGPTNKLDYRCSLREELVHIWGTYCNNHLYSSSAYSMPDLRLSFQCHNLSLVYSYNIKTIITPLLQMRRSRLKRVKSLATHIFSKITQLVDEGAGI